MLNRYTVLFSGIAMAVEVMAAAINTPGDIAARLDALHPYAAEADFEVWLPSASDPVTYKVNLLSDINSDADTLLPCDYLIDWTLPRPNGESHGFSAYFSGNHYRYRDGRLQEYHYADNAEAFAPAGRLRQGVQRQAQFVDLLPTSISAELRTIDSDSCYTYMINERNGVTIIDGSQTMAGSEVKSFKYSFDSATGRPLKLDIYTNPGQISEQNLTVEYSYPATDTHSRRLPRNEDALIALYPEEFAKYRRSDFRLEKLPGQLLPEFSAQALDGSRYTHHRRDSFDAPVILLILDSEVGRPAEVLSQVRSAIDTYPGSIQTIVAFIDNKAEDVEALAGAGRQGETVLYGARALARDCGVTTTPVVISADADGKVIKFIQGMNKNLADEVLDMCINLK